MGILLVIGSNGPIQQTDDKQWSFPQGETTAQTYKGVYSYVQSLYDQYKAYAGSSPTIDGLNLHYERGMGTLTVSTVQDGPIQYELVSNQESRPIFAHPYFADTSPLSAAELHAVRIAFELGINHNPDQQEAAPFDGSAFTAKQSSLYSFLTQGVETYQQSAYVLRQTQVCSKRSTVQASFTDANKVSTPPNTSAVNSLIGSLPSGEWLKQSPNVRMYGNKKWQISQEWWWAPKWSSILYSGTGSP